MRASWFWLLLIALAAASIVAGYVSGERVRPPATVQLHPDPNASGVPLRRTIVRGEQRSYSGGDVTDLFSNDDVVTQRPLPADFRWHAPRLAVVVGLTGYSAAIESQFLTLGIPLAFDIDPAAPEAAKVAAEARDAGALVLVHVDGMPGQAALSVLRHRLGSFAGVATRDAAPLARALAGTRLIVFDERGATDPGRLDAPGSTIVSRDVLADNRAEAGYVSFMLDRALDRSIHGGTVVVLLRPLPTTLDALGAFARDHDVEFTAIR